MNYQTNLLISPSNHQFVPRMELPTEVSRKKRPGPKEVLRRAHAKQQAHKLKGKAKAS